MVRDDDRWVTLRAVVELRVAKTTELTSRDLVHAVSELLDKEEVIRRVRRWGLNKSWQVGAVKVKEYSRVRNAEHLRLVSEEERP